MRSFQTITVGLSLTASDVDVLQYAALVARLGVTREVRFVHVAASGRSSELPLGRQDALTRLESLVAGRFDASDCDLRISCQVVEGTRADALVDFVTARDSDLILLGHRQQHRRRNSLAQRLATVAPCSVWTVPRRAPTRITKILAPVDFSEHSADSLSQATAISCLNGIDECLALHVSSPPTVEGSDAADNAARLPQHQHFTQFLKPVNAHGVDIHTRLVHSPQVAPAILNCARQTAADLIVLSTRGAGPGDSSPLGTVASQVLLESDVPVLAVRHYNNAWPAHASHTA